MRRRRSSASCRMRCLSSSPCSRNSLRTRSRSSWILPSFASYSASLFSAASRRRRASSSSRTMLSLRFTSAFCSGCLPNLTAMKTSTPKLMSCAKKGGGSPGSRQRRLGSTSGFSPRSPCHQLMGGGGAFSSCSACSACACSACAASARPPCWTAGACSAAGPCFACGAWSRSDPWAPARTTTKSVASAARTTVHRARPAITRSPFRGRATQCPSRSAARAGRVRTGGSSSRRRASSCPRR